MKLGPAIRRVLPHSIERRAAQLYRLAFVDLDKVAAQLGKALPVDGNILDIGGGDGELLNCLFRIRPDLRITMVDIAPSVGRFLAHEHRDQVRFFPKTPIDAHLSDAAGSYDAAIVSDVMHHIPEDLRANFVSDVLYALRPAAPLFVKDIEPGHPVATLSLYADRYISGDKGVSLVSMQEMIKLVGSIRPGYRAHELGLITVNRPNYILEFSSP